MSRTRTLAAAAAAVALLATAGSAFANQSAIDPFGDAASTAYIGNDPNDGNTQWIGWKNKSTGVCSWQQLGNANGLFGLTEVWARGGNDTIVVLTSGATWCGFYITPPIFGGYVMDIYGENGDDLVKSEGTANVAFISGGDGNDVISSGKANAFLSGDWGNDTIRATGVGNGGSIYGYEGNDCIQVLISGTPATVSCGNGTDQWWGSGARPWDCEVTACDCYLSPC